VTWRYSTRPRTNSNAAAATRTRPIIRAASPLVAEKRHRSRSRKSSSKKTHRKGSRKLAVNPLVVTAAAEHKRYPRKLSATPVVSQKRTPRKLSATPVTSEHKRYPRKLSATPVVSQKRTPRKLSATPVTSEHKRYPRKLSVNPLTAEALSEKRHRHRSGSRRKPSAYNKFVRDRMGSVVRKHPNMPQKNRLKVVASEWNRMKHSKKGSKKSSSRKLASYATNPKSTNKKMSLSYLLKYF